MADCINFIYLLWFKSLSWEMIMIELTENGKQVRPAPAADTLRGQHVQSALSEDEKGESILNLDDILQDVGLDNILSILR